MTETNKRVAVTAIPRARSVRVLQPPRLIGPTVGLNARMLGASIDISMQPVRMTGNPSEEPNDLTEVSP